MSKLIKNQIFILGLFTLILSSCGGSGSKSLLNTTSIPSNLNATASDKQISLNWDSIDDATYNLYYATQSIADIENYKSYNGGTLLLNLTNNSKTITGLTNQTKYYSRVTALKNNIESLPSNQVSATPFIVTPPPSTTTGKLNDTGITWGW